MITEKQLKEKGFKEVVNKDGAFVLEMPISESVSVRTWGHTEEGEILGVYLYDKPTDKYTEALPLE